MKKTLIKIIGNRNKAQLAIISDLYGKKQKHSLEKDLKGDCSGTFLKLLLGLIRPIMTVKIETLKEAMNGIGTREKGLIDVICLATHEEISLLHQMYPECARRVRSETSGHFRYVLEAILSGKRIPYTQMDPHLAEKIAKDLYDAGEKRWGTDEAVFSKVFTTYLPEFLQLVSSHYHRRYGHSLRAAVEKETSGEYQTALLALLGNPWDYYCDRLFQAMKGIGTDDKALVYIFSILDSWQLKYIEKMFYQRHSRQLKDMIRGDCSGNYRDLLLEVVS